MEHLEEILSVGVSGLRLFVVTIGAAIIGIGVIRVLIRWVRGRIGAEPAYTFRGVRIALSGYLALALEFQLAGDILSSAIAPSWQELGKLAAIAAIRTFLNFFLERETEGLQSDQNTPQPA